MFDPFPAVTLREFCRFAPVILHAISRSTPRRHKKTGIRPVRRVGCRLSGFSPGPLLSLTDVLLPGQRP
ncbi:hypothetical protein BVD23_09755 [Salmonella enterica]|nr:hypothetical protein [Salmonella enterica]EBI7618001.1 hypothetical protein [Salmonella enterica]EBI8099911.1 hypothetical protein [Salmonella enterica]EBK3005127.1 hypothetical protein [Salmonella enterica]EBK9151435.1 hypothetical protein [Salmonella enterica]